METALFVGAAIGVAVVAMVAGGGASNDGGAVADAIQAITGGTTLLPDGTVTADGVNPADPAGLAAGAGVDLDTYALARMIASEANGQKQIAQQAVGCVAMNHARDEGKSISAILLHSTHAGDGFFGKQSEGRYAATSRDPSSLQLQVAADIIAGNVPDPTGGARQWDSPRSYKVPSRADEIASARYGAGNDLVVLPGVPASTFRFWKPSGVA